FILSSFLVSVVVPTAACLRAIMSSHDKQVIIPMVQLYASTTTCLIIMSLRWRKGAHAKPCTSQLTSTSVKLGSG
ncbi:unnamed protein product, partial [Fusarium graminearum]